MKNNKQIVVISDFPVISNILSSYKITIDTLPSKATDILPNYQTIDIAIFDLVGPEAPSFDIFNIKTIVNLGNNFIDDAEITLNKPIRLEELLEIIKLASVANQLFTRINSQWIYDQQQACIFDRVGKIKFTNKENQIFSQLLLAPNYSLHKNELVEQIWQYHPDTDSATIETHLYKLKQKLPENLMILRDSYCVLAPL